MHSHVQRGNEICIFIVKFLEKDLTIQIQGNTMTRIKIQCKRVTK